MTPSRIPPRLPRNSNRGNAVPLSMPTPPFPTTYPTNDTTATTLFPGQDVQTDGRIQGVWDRCF